MISDSQLFVVSRPRPEAKCRLFCFPHAGGGPIAFYDWAERLGMEVECVCLQYPGRGTRLRETPVTSVGKLVEEIGKDIPKIVEKPFTLYGHSLGGLVAFELTRYLRRNGYPLPNQLFVGASRPPHLKSPFPPIHHLPDRQFIDEIQARYGGIPEAIYRSPEVLDMFLPAMRGDFTAYETYMFQEDAPLDIPIFGFAGAEDAAVSVQSIREWALHTTAGFEINVFPGGHFFSASNGESLANVLHTHIHAFQNGRKSIQRVSD